MPPYLGIMMGYSEIMLLALVFYVCRSSGGYVVNDHASLGHYASVQNIFVMSCLSFCFYCACPIEGCSPDCDGGLT